MTPEDQAHLDEMCSRMSTNVKTLQLQLLVTMGFTHRITDDLCVLLEWLQARDYHTDPVLQVAITRISYGTSGISDVARWIMQVEPHMVISDPSDSSKPNLVDPMTKAGLAYMQDVHASQEDYH